MSEVGEDTSFNHTVTSLSHSLHPLSLHPLPLAHSSIYRYESEGMKMYMVTGDPHEAEHLTIGEWLCAIHEDLEVRESLSTVSVSLCVCMSVCLFLLVCMSLSTVRISLSVCVSLSVSSL